MSKTLLGGELKENTARDTGNSLNDRDMAIEPA